MSFVKEQSKETPLGSWDWLGTSLQDPRGSAKTRGLFPLSTGMREDPPSPSFRSPHHWLFLSSPCHLSLLASSSADLAPGTVVIATHGSVPQTSIIAESSFQNDSRTHANFELEFQELEL